MPVYPTTALPETLTEEEWRHTIDINLTGAFFVIQAFAKKLLDAGHPGSIVNVASMCAHITLFPAAGGSL